MPWVFCCSDENLIDKTTLCSHPFSINTYLGLFLPLASLNSTIYHDAVINNPFHSFVLPHPSLFCKTPLLANVFPPKAMQICLWSVMPSLAMFMSQHHAELAPPLTCGWRTAPSSCGVAMGELTPSLKALVWESWSCLSPRGEGSDMGVEELAPLFASYHVSGGGGGRQQ